MSLALRIASRYLPRRQSGGAGSITRVALCGIAVAAAALVCVLSVFNGFRQVLVQNASALSPDVMVVPAKGKVLEDYEGKISRISSIKGVEKATPTISGRALAVYGGREMPVMVKGVVENEYPDVSRIRSIIYPDGKYSLSGEAEPLSLSDEAQTDEEMLDQLLAEEETEEKHSILAAGTATRLSAHPGDKEFILFTPRKDREVNLANPVSSFIMVPTVVSGVFSTRQADFDKDYVITDIDVARELFGMESGAGAIEISLNNDADPEAMLEKISSVAGKNVIVKDRLQQQSLNFRMVSVEKWITFLLLTFILLIASFNVVASLSMLVIEKAGDLSTLRCMGMKSRKIGRIFIWESLYITILGGAVGIILGIILCLFQKNFGLIKLSGDTENMVLSHYPVEIWWPDIAAIAGIVIATGLIAGSAVAAFARRRSRIGGMAQA